MSITTGKIHNTNAACCTIPPVQSSYEPKGKYGKYAGFEKVYITGPERSQNALVCVYDIFGFFPQTQQGADILAETLSVKVYMPDFFEPDKPFPFENFPPQTDEGKAELQSFFGTTANPQKAVSKLIEVGKALKSDGAKYVGAYGFCWGGKVSLVAGGENTPFDAISIVHPAMLSVDDAVKLTVPLGIYISKDEPVDEYEKIVIAISGKPWAAKSDHKYYTNMFHGWAAARADLNNEENKKEFGDVYEKIANFFNNAWGT